MKIPDISLELVETWSPNEFDVTFGDSNYEASSCFQF